MADAREGINKCAASRIVWKFIPVKAAWFGGIYERMIGLLKTELKKVSAGGWFSEFHFINTIREIQGVINARPLTQLGDEEVLTPFHLLNGFGPDIEFPLSSVDTSKVLLEAIAHRPHLPQLYIKTQARKEKFWGDFQRQYLESIKFTSDPGSAGGLLPKVGDVCIVHSTDPRFAWKKAIVLELIHSADGELRKCRIRTPGGETIRAVSNLFPLELTAEAYIDPDKRLQAEEVCRQEEGDDFEGFEAPDEPWRAAAAAKMSLLKKMAQESAREERIERREAQKL